MSVETTYSQLREQLASVLDRVVDDREVVIVRRKTGKDVALIAADELAGLLETAHLLRSPKNAQRLRESIREAERGQLKPKSVEKLRREMGLAKR
jgi:antitoxin YefM